MLEKIKQINDIEGQKYIVLSKVREKKAVLIDAITGSWNWS